MNPDLARHLARTFRIGRDLEEALALLRTHLPADQYPACAREVAGALHAVQTALLDRALAALPGLREEIDASLARNGRYL